METDPFRRTLILIFYIKFKGDGFVSFYCTQLNISFYKVFFCSISRSSQIQLATACTQTLLKDLNLFNSWIGWHYMNGFTNMTIYINQLNSIDYLNDMFKDYVQKGIVSFITWVFPGPKYIERHTTFSQVTCQMSCIFRSRSSYHWVGLHDVDEFFVSPLYKNVKTILNKYLYQDCSSLRICMQYFKLSNNSVIFDVDQVCSSCVFQSYKQIVKPKHIHFFFVHFASADGPILSLSSQELTMAHLKPFSTCNPTNIFKEYQLTELIN